MRGTRRRNQTGVQLQDVEQSVAVLDSVMDTNSSCYMLEYHFQRTPVSIFNNMFLRRYHISHLHLRHLIYICLILISSLLTRIRAKTLSTQRRQASPRNAGWDRLYMQRLTLFRSAPSYTFLFTRLQVYSCAVQELLQHTPPSTHDTPGTDPISASPLKQHLVSLTTSYLVPTSSSERSFWNRRTYTLAWPNTLDV